LNTIEDLGFLRTSGLSTRILNAHDHGKKIIGICGGYQMMGEEVSDPYGVESDKAVLPGLRLLPIKTTLTKEKVTLQQEFYYRNHEAVCTGYEIHMGETTTSNPSPFLKLKDKEEGYWKNKNCWGSYMHGILDNQVVIDELLENTSTVKVQSYQAFKEENYDKMATLLRENLDMNLIYDQILNRVKHD